MKLLILGGTVFLGRAVVDAARERGHDVTIFHRGTHPGHRDDVEVLHGDRDGALDALRGHTWDAVVDTSGYVPRVVRSGVEVLRSSGVRSYVFVSTVNAYPDPPAGLSEATPAHEPLEAEEVTGETYGPLKVGCEQAVHAAFGDAGLAVRAGLIVGPHDPTNRFTYWCTRVAEGGQVLAPAVPDQPVQVVDVRDLATFCVQAAERGHGGIVNVQGPRGAVTFAGLLETVREVSGSDASIVWVDPARLEAEGVEPWSELPLWVPPHFRADGMLDGDDTRARAMGASFRPIRETIADTLAWARDAPPARGFDTGVGMPPAGLDRDREAALLAEMR